MTIGQILRTARKKQKISQLEVAKQLGYDNPQFVSLVERDLSKLPPSKLIKWCEILSVSTRRIVKLKLEFDRKKFISEVENL